MEFRINCILGLDWVWQAGKKHITKVNGLTQNSHDRLVLLSIQNSILFVFLRSLQKVLGNAFQYFLHLIQLFVSRYWHYMDHLCKEELGNDDRGWGGGLPNCVKYFGDSCWFGIKRPEIMRESCKSDSIEPATAG